MARNIEQRLCADPRDLLSIQIGNVLQLTVSIMMLAVGAMGLTSMMSLNVMERTHEIGTLRTLGASTCTIMELVIGEGVVIGLLSWVLSGITAVPVAVLIGNIAGERFLHRSLDLVFPLWIPLVWLAIIVGVAVVACFVPALRAARLMVREAQAFE